LRFSDSSGAQPHRCLFSAWHYTQWSIQPLNTQAGTPAAYQRGACLKLGVV
jgi:hypothetical protein